MHVDDGEDATRSLSGQSRQITDYDRVPLARMPWPIWMSSTLLLSYAIVSGAVMLAIPPASIVLFPIPIVAISEVFAIKRRKRHSYWVGFIVGGAVAIALGFGFLTLIIEGSGLSIISELIGLTLLAYALVNGIAAWGLLTQRARAWFGLAPLRWSLK